MSTEAWERAVEAGILAVLRDETFPHEVAGKVTARSLTNAALRAAFPILAEDADDALRRVSEWAAAYPPDVFPEVDLEKAKAALEAAGINYSALHGTWARHLMNGVAGIVDPARARIQQMAEAL